MWPHLIIYGSVDGVNKTFQHSQRTQKWRPPSTTIRYDCIIINPIHNNMASKQNNNDQKNKVIIIIIYIFNFSFLYVFNEVIIIFRLKI